MSDKRIDEATHTETMGHEWDGIEELNTPLPRWWLYLLCLHRLCGGLCGGLSSVPLLHEAPMAPSAGPGEYAAEQKAEAAQRAPVLAALAKTPIEDLPKNPDLMRQAVAGGRAAFKVNCVQCHGAGAAGSVGYPNLNDDDWLWGGSLTDIQQTLTHGIRYPGDDQTRTSLMPSFGHDKILTPAQVQDVPALCAASRAWNPRARQPSAAEIFAVNCVACHGPEGKEAASSARPT
jgi:cytochrome c oxidase cbb3-type subunit 3